MGPLVERLSPRLGSRHQARKGAKQKEIEKQSKQIENRNKPNTKCEIGSWMNSTGHTRGTRRHIPTTTSMMHQSGNIKTRRDGAQMKLQECAKKYLKHVETVYKCK